MKNHILRSLTFLPIIGIVAGCNTQEPVIETVEAPVEKSADAYYIPGRVSVQFNEETTLRIEEALAQGQPTKA
ncbi:MAG: hypothetical protein IJ813_05000, partial [Bacteroidales bacterium]|nr:hypothetical protein [Bacteroidales bacterium]